MPGGFRRKRAREERRVRVDGNGLRRAVVGDAGLADDELAHLLAGLEADAEQLERQRRPGWALLPATRTDLREIRRLRERVAADIGDVVVITSPEIALATEALASALACEAPTPTRPRLHVVDGPDPDRFAALVETLEWPRTLVVVASVGDADLLTTSHFLVVRDRLLRELGAVEYQRHVVVATSPGDTGLGQIVHDEGFRSVALADAGDHATSALGLATLLPLGCVGIDTADIVAGAAAMLERRHQADGVRPAHLLAAAVRLTAPAGPRVIPPATRSLQGLARWMERRLAVPLTEAAGPRRPVTLVLGAAADAEALVVPQAYQDVETVGFVGGLDLGALSARTREADELARWANGELTLSVTLPDVSPHAVGQLVALTEAAACLAHPSAAPTAARTRAARLAFGLVGRPGYEADRALAERLAGLREERWVA